LWNSVIVQGTPWDWLGGGGFVQGRLGPERTSGSPPSLLVRALLPIQGTHERIWHLPSLSELLILTLQPLLSPSDVRRSRRSVLATTPPPL